jgi:hypothetical protein
MEYLPTPQDVVRQLLIENEFGVMPGIAQVVPDQRLEVDPPQIFTRAFPDDVSYLIWLKQIRGKFWEFVSDGEPQEHKGLHVMVRYPLREEEDLGYTLAESLWRFLGKVSDETVTVGNYTFRIQGIYRTSPILDIGEQEEESRSDWAFEMNVVFAYPPYQLIED